MRRSWEKRVLQEQEIPGAGALGEFRTIKVGTI